MTRQAGLTEARRVPSAADRPPPRSALMGGDQGTCVSSPSPHAWTPPPKHCPRCYGALYVDDTPPLTPVGQHVSSATTAHSGGNRCSHPTAPRRLPDGAPTVNHP